MSTPDNNSDTPNSQQGSDEGSQQEIDYEKRFKDTQAAYTKQQQKLKAMEVENEALKKVAIPVVNIDEKKQAELDELLDSDPHAWRQEMNKLEDEATKFHNDSIATAVSEFTAQAELERRTQVLADYNKSHGVNITDEQINYDVPLRITDRLEKGEVTFEEFLDEVTDYLNLPKKVGTNTKTMGQPNLGKEGGDNTPTQDSKKKDFVESYKTMQF